MWGKSNFVHENDRSGCLVQESDSALGEHILLGDISSTRLIGEFGLKNIFYENTGIDSKKH